MAMPAHLSPDLRLETLDEVGAWVVHALPGRVRLRWPSGRQEDAVGIAARCQAHHAVRDVKLVEAARSITVGFDPAYRFDDVLRTLPRGVRPPSLPAADHFGLDWSRVLLAGLLALLPLGPFGSVAVSVVGSVVEQVSEHRSVRRLAPKRTA